MTTKKIIGFLMLASVGLMFVAMLVFQHGLWQTLIALAIFGVFILFIGVGVHLIDS